MSLEKLNPCNSCKYSGQDFCFEQFIRNEELEIMYTHMDEKKKKNIGIAKYDCPYRRK